MVRELSNLPPGCTDWDIEEQCREPGPCECGHSVEDHQDRTTATGKTLTGGGAGAAGPGRRGLGILNLKSAVPVCHVCDQPIVGAWLKSDGLLSRPGRVPELATAFP